MGIISLIKPLKKYEDYFYRANTYENLFLIKKAIQIMDTAIKQEFTKEEKSSGYIYLGILYSKTKEFSKASNCYNQGLDMMRDENFKYSSNFKKAIKIFIINKDEERAKFWLNNLLQRQSYDKKFKKLTDLKSKVQ
ncbi:hypothetical protein [Paenisporosarcina sp. OV554]|uniref:hypothetical protein n=1 Tax=Paenisporosarcina sp. OV554 TaxID=2135694 RepID=UPI000D371A3C|nr:hypothetical protein [Paenisporosarcina sp. OV554]PUB09988.1 hypothetical protein C8K15_12212 [Paenisporosarcina sp. OV554]